MKNSFNAKNLLQFFPLTRKRDTFSLIAILLAGMLAFSFGSPQVSAASTGSTLNYYLTIKPDFAGQGYNALSPQWIVAQQGDQINLTIRNLGSELLHMQIEGQPEIKVMPGTQNGSEISPVESNVPIFNALTPGIFNIGTTEHPEDKRSNRCHPN